MAAEEYVQAFLNAASRTGEHMRRLQKVHLLEKY